jgi:hypothetical protein
MAMAGIESRGAIFTRREVVDFILDLVGYTTDQPLHQARILEPAMGQGDFLVPTIERLLSTYWRVPEAERGNVINDLGNCLRAVELHRATYDHAYRLVHNLLCERGFRTSDADGLCRLWLHEGDYLLLPSEGTFTHIVGNPPYIRQELIPDALMAEYRRRYVTIYDRADIYVPFIERSLSLLAPGGQLGIICADRWMKNRYGGPLRQLVANHFHLRYYVDMVDTGAFQANVIAYPAIFVISRENRRATRVAFRPNVDAAEMTKLARVLAAPKIEACTSVHEITCIANGDRPWMVEAPDQLALAQRIEAGFPTLDDAGCKVSIGVATGADKVFIGPFDELDVEADRKLPLATTKDILTGTVKWRGLGVINPFTDDGGLVPLRNYPRLAAYLELHGAAIKARHVSKRNSGSWYRTIDRIYPALTTTPKLLIPDIKGEANVVYEPGKLYPHHNLYFVVSDTWDLRALQAVLLSNVTRFFIRLYSTKMRGGYLRFQAQYLRRLRLPRWDTVPIALRERLSQAAVARDFRACDAAAVDLYRLTTAERVALME